jgi:hypothetical protein
MPQFDVYPNPVEELRLSHPYVLSIQSDLLKSPVGVITVALARRDAQKRSWQHSQPLAIDFIPLDQFLLDTVKAAAVRTITPHE